MKHHSIIPIFIPHKGCPNDCIFCNQKKITARQKAVTDEDVRTIIETWLSTLEPRGVETIEIFGGYPVDLQPTIEELLCAAKHNEFEEADDVYMAFAETAKEEGLLEASSAFYQIAKIEKIHGNRFEKLANMLKDGCYFQQPEGGEWMCLNCGHIHKGMLVPEVCPVCRREKGFFIPLELAPYMSEELR